jgi:predicted permease
VPHDSARRRYLHFFRADPRRDVDEELAFHLAMRMDEYRDAGLSDAQAEDQAMRRFGDYSQVRDECDRLSHERLARTTRRYRWATLRDDVRYALRALASQPAFAIAVTATLALGIGANSAVFSVAYGVLLRPLPYRDADALVRLWSRKDARGLDFFSVSPADYKVWRADATTLSATAAFERQRDAVLLRGAEPQSVEISAVTPDIFPLLGTAAQMGRTLMTDDARAGAPAVAVVSYYAWTNRFGADSALVGSELLLDGRRHVVVGVMPPRFYVPGTSAEIWTPLSLDAASADHADRYLRVLARLAPGATPDGALRQLNVIAARLAQQFATSNAGWSVNMMGIPELVVGRQFRRSVLVLSGVVALVLLIACANAANLQLARAASRRHEIALRAALGASRQRIARQLMAESTILGIAGGLGGLALAKGGLVLLRDYGETIVPRLGEIRLDRPVLLFTLTIAILSGVLFGVLPALRASRANLGDVLKESGRQTGASVGEGIRSSLVIAEIALSVVLLVGAGLLLRSFAYLQHVDLGFEPRDVLITPIAAPAPAEGQREVLERFTLDVLDRARAQGWKNVAVINSAPFAGPNSGLRFQRADRPVPPDQAPDADVRLVTPGYVRLMGIRLVRGRDLASTDRAGAEAALVSETMARLYWPNEDPVGRRIRLGNAGGTAEVTIVGMVGDVRYQSLETAETRPMLYLSALARPPRAMQLVVRGDRAAERATSLRDLVVSVTPGQPAPTVSRMDDLVNRATATQRFVLGLFIVFAVAALTLAVIGVYSVMSYVVRLRTHEMGIRLALGAPREAVVRLVVASALRLTVAGVTLGLLGAWVLTRFLSTILFGVGTRDPITFAAIGALIVFAAFLAALMPARRATRADPMLALRRS